MSHSTTHISSSKKATEKSGITNNNKSGSTVECVDNDPMAIPGTTVPIVDTSKVPPKAQMQTIPVPPQYPISINGPSALKTTLSAPVNVPFEILEWEWNEEKKARTLKVNRLPTLEDFVWQKVYEIDPTVEPEALGKRHEEFFWIIGTLERLNLKIVFFCFERDHIGPSPIRLNLKIGKVLILDRYDLHHNAGVTTKWIGNKITCIATNPDNEKDYRVLYKYI